MLVCSLYSDSPFLNGPSSNPPVPQFYSLRRFLLLLLLLRPRPRPQAAALFAIVPSNYQDLLKAKGGVQGVSELFTRMRPTLQVRSRARRAYRGRPREPPSHVASLSAPCSQRCSDPPLLSLSFASPTRAGVFRHHREPEGGRGVRARGRAARGARGRKRALDLAVCNWLLFWHLIGCDSPPLRAGGAWRWDMLTVTVMVIVAFLLSRGGGLQTETNHVLHGPGPGRRRVISTVDLDVDGRPDLSVSFLVTFF